MPNEANATRDRRELPLEGDVRRGGTGPLPAVVTAGFAFALVTVAAMALLAFRSAAARGESAQSVRQTLTVLGQIEAVSGLAAELGRGVRGFLVAGDASALADRASLDASLAAEIDRLAELTAGDPQQGERLPDLRARVGRYLEVQDELTRLARTAGIGAARERFALGEGERRFDAVSGVLADMAAIEQLRLAERQSGEAAADRRQTTTLALLALVTVLLLAGSFLLVRRHAIERDRADRALRRLNAELADRGRALADANAELEAFAYTVSHDLRAPLRHMSGFVELLERSARDRLEPEDRRKLEVISGAARKMGALIDDLLAFSRLGRREMSRETVDLDTLVDEVIADLDGDLEGRAVEWRRRPLSTARGDAPMLRQLLANLVGNAVKFTRGREPAVIEIAPAEAPPGELSVVVRDNGAGFDPRYADKLFGVFQRLHRAEEFEGTGVGLAIARRVVVRHGGRIWAESGPGAGASFHFTLPRPALEGPREARGVRA